ncbi:hypothetical protein DSM43276_03289 [Mycobacteroides salmoniphilum]|nr:hypothetical protein DSM43276_03289 [Mycobacteroides salmoniphilum]
MNGRWTRVQFPAAPQEEKTPRMFGGPSAFQGPVLPAQAIQTVLILQNSRMPWAESSRPYPERLMPPNGTSG